MAELAHDLAQNGSRPATPDVNAAIGALWERFKGIAFERLATIDTAVTAQHANQLDDDLRRRAEREAHKLAGSVGSFGFAEGSRIAREIELLLQSPLGPAETGRVESLAAQLREVLQKPGSQAADPGPAEALSAAARPARDMRPLLLMALADGQRACQIADEAEARRLRHRAVGDATDARAALGEDPPDVVLLDLLLDGQIDHGLALLDEVVRRIPRALPVVVAANITAEQRLDALRRGARVVFTSAASPVHIVEKAAELLASPDAAPCRVLLVDDDADTLARTAEQLRAPRTEVITLDDPQRFWETLERTRPDAVLVDEAMPAPSGLELCGAIRGDPRWANLPVLVLAAAGDCDTVTRAFAAGADDLVVLPSAGPELRARLDRSLERRRMQRTIAEQDPLTGLANRQRSLASLDGLIAAAERQRQALSVAIVDVDGMHDVLTQFGESVADAMLQRVGRALAALVGHDEVAGRWDGDAFVLALAGCDADDAVARLRRVLDRLAAAPVVAADGTILVPSFCAAVATHPMDGQDAHALICAAEQGVRATKGEGRGEVTAVGWSKRGDGPTELVDIALVEDDVALAGLLGHTLETRGHSTRVICDGAQAVEALCGPTPRLRARVIVLDVDLPGRDGFDVLRALARDGVTERSRVVMLTVRATEPEVVRALEMGAFDHIAKPFSVQILMQRLRRALGE